MRRSGSESSVDSATGSPRASLPGEIGRLLFVLACLMACFAAGVVAYLRDRDFFGCLPTNDCTHYDLNETGYVRS